MGAAEYFKQPPGHLKRINNVNEFCNERAEPNTRKEIY